MTYDPKLIRGEKTVKRDGSNTLTNDWDIGDDRRIILDGVEIRDNSGFNIDDTTGNNVFHIDDLTGKISLRYGSSVNKISNTVTSNSEDLLTAFAVDTAINNGISSGGFLKADGSVSLTSDWNADGAKTLYIDTANFRVGVAKIPEYTNSRFEVLGKVVFDYVDGTEGTFQMRNETRDATHIQWTFSKRNNNKDLWIYSYDGSTYKTFAEFLWDNQYLVFPSGTSVGIQTDSPDYPLEVNGAIASSSSQTTANLGSNLVTNGTFDSDLTGWTATNWSYSSGTALHTVGFTNALTQNITVTSGTSYEISFSMTGRTAGSVKIDINGVYIYSASATTSFNSGDEKSLIADITGSATLSITPTSTFDGAIDNVSVKAISITTPQYYALDDSAGVAMQIRADTGLQNTFVGTNSGRVNTIGANNTAIGTRALYENTTGDNNTAIGRYALTSNTTGYSNAATGVNALFNNIAGFFNTATGYQALYNNTTGNNNTAIGANCHLANTTGDYNTAIGYQAGRYIANGSTNNQLSGTSVYLGANTKSLASGDSNEIVIGYNAIGIGSNTVVLGNDSITKTALKGNVGIDTTTPNQKLTIEGTMSLKEQAAAGADTASYGQIWVKNTTPNELWFTDDAGTDFQLNSSGASSGVDFETLKRSFIL